METKRVIDPYLTQTVRPADGSIDAAFITPESTEEALYFANKLRKRLVQSAVVWIMFSSRTHPCELNQQFSEDMEQSGWVQIDTISINDSYIAVGYVLSPMDKNESE